MLPIINQTSSKKPIYDLQKSRSVDNVVPTDLFASQAPAVHRLQSAPEWLGPISVTYE